VVEVSPGSYWTTIMAPYRPYSEKKVLYWYF